MNNKRKNGGSWRPRACFVRVNYAVPIFGWVRKRLKQFGPAVYEVMAFSAHCPDGESGDEFFDEGVFPISEADFELARAANWQVSREAVVEMVRKAGCQSEIPPASTHPTMTVVPDPFTGGTMVVIDTMKSYGSPKAETHPSSRAR